ncbi:hypothetical protein [Litoreibacter roseus]|uniref:Uncharacterized protein n=1 Tax=Litoreibacter roseus TaxID=2601869 RepID=A0A6N6JBF0_9RHOB|nr:hypothetical protein [Litoreibacter roseus]GFE63581.1 hypothetical protein KIN_06550 [Litoreibacter roseus]
MSAPDTNLETQKSRHRGPLGGMAIILTFAGILLLALLVWTFFNGLEPGGTDAQIDGRTGAAVESE